MSRALQPWNTCRHVQRCIYTQEWIFAGQFLNMHIAYTSDQRHMWDIIDWRIFFWYLIFQSRFNCFYTSMNLKCSYLLKGLGMTTEFIDFVLDIKWLTGTFTLHCIKKQTKQTRTHRYTLYIKLGIKVCDSRWLTFLREEDTHTSHAHTGALWWTHCWGFCVFSLSTPYWSDSAELAPVWEKKCQPFSKSLTSSFSV